MSHPIGTYSFLPWLRQGLANQIQAGTSENGRAVVNVQLRLDGTKIAGGQQSETVSRNVALFGPGDIQGIDPRAIFRVEPRNWITNYETNYLPCIEFYDEDFPWRYSPMAPDGSGRLLPWLVLVVLEERSSDPEFTEGVDVRNKPLPYVDVPGASVFPAADQLWAWAHVHVNRSLAANDAEFVSTDMNAVLPRLQAVLAENPDLAYSRVVCPRKLDENKAYHAFLMPSFESGRRAGLGLDPHLDPALPAVTAAAWAAYPNRPEPTRYPYYFRWYFRTGGKGDFESLVRLLKPKPVDNRVGRRDMDVQVPGSNVRGVQVGRPDLGGVLKLGGALKVPDSSFVGDERTEMLKYENWATPYPQPIQQDLAKLVNLADDYDALAAEAANQAAGLTDPDDPSAPDPDPVITAPLYGTWHAMTKRLLLARDGTALSPDDNWVHELNLDPRFRVTAGFGTRVVQDQQEKYMDVAWEQIGRVLEANRRIRAGQLAASVSTIWYDRHLLPLAAVNRQGALLLMAPLNKRVLHDGLTVHQQFLESNAAPAATSRALRRIARPRGRLVQSLPFDDKEARLDTLLDLVESGRVSAAPPKVTPPGATTLESVATAIDPKGEPKTGTALDDTPPPDSVYDIKPSPQFVITPIGSRDEFPSGNEDSPEAKNFKGGLRDAYRLLGGSLESGKLPPKKQLDLRGVANTALAALDPQRTIPRRVLSAIGLPPRVRAEIGEQFVEAMAYPVIDAPMYEPLKNISSELFLPNIHLIEQNSITILETNQKFIEAYMVGLNHEFARELLWREYPTDQRGSYFRQFWDVSGFLDTESLDDEALREKLRDIPRLDRWLRASKLGSHDHREVPGETEEEVVLVIRGELLKRYPTAVIYAHRAVWQLNSDGTPDTSKERRLAPLTAAEEANPPRTKVLTPLYEAKVDPDIFFFGFDLKVTEARGGTGEPGDQDPGWFFVIKERPGEPRFGLDLEQQPAIEVWNDLSWVDVQPGNPGTFIPATQTFALTTPPAGDEKLPQHQDDVHISWNPNMSAADVAYVLFQAPVLVAVHASEMLPRE